MLFLKALIIITLGFILIQDHKNREVYWFLFPGIMLLLGLLHYYNSLLINFSISIITNLLFVFVLLCILYLYTIIKIKKPFFKEVFGIGDVLFFTGIAVAFPTITFIIIFVFSILFSILVWAILKRKSEYQTIPLAGYMSLFLLLLLVGNWSSNIINLYLI